MPKDAGGYLFIYERALKRPLECNSFYAECGYFEKDEPKMRLFAILACLALMLGAPEAAHAASGGKPVIDSRTFGDWKLDCIKDKNNAVSDCQLMQKHYVDGKDGKKKPLLAALGALVTSKDKSGKAQTRLFLRMFTPLNTLLPVGLAVKLDNGKPMKIPFIACAPIGCMAELPVSEDLLGQLKKGNALLVAYKDAQNGKQQNATVSLKGFTAAYDALKKG